MNGMAPARLSTTTTPDGSIVLTDKAMAWVPRYDTSRFVAGTSLPSQINFFQVPVGAAGSGFPLKTDAHTNQLHQNKLEKGVSISVRAIEIAIYMVGAGRNGNRVSRFIAALFEDAHIKFKVDDTIELECRLMDFAKGSGMTGVPFMNAALAQNYVAPAPTIRGKRLLARNIPLAARQRFELELFPNQANTFLNSTIQPGDDIAITAALVGPTTRPIE